MFVEGSRKFPGFPWGQVLPEEKAVMTGDTVHMMLLEQEDESTDGSSEPGRRARGQAFEDPDEPPDRREKESLTHCGPIVLDAVAKAGRSLGPLTSRDRILRPIRAGDFDADLQGSPRSREETTARTVAQGVAEPVVGRGPRLG